MISFQLKSRMPNLAVLAAMLGAFTIASGAATAQDALFVAPSGNVGIGTNAPGHVLVVQGADGDTRLRIRDATSGGVAAQEYVNNGRVWLIGVRGDLSDSFSFRDQTGGAHRFVINTNGNIGIGTTVAGAKLHVRNLGIDGTILRLQDSDGTCNLNPEAGSLQISCSSDRSLKTNIREANTAATLDQLLKIKLFDYDVVASGDSRMGPVAQDLREVQPDKVQELENGTLVVTQPSQYELLAAIQELTQRLTGLQAEVETLRTQLSEK